MSDREKLIELVSEIVVPYFAELIADHLLANGVQFKNGTPLEDFDWSVRTYNTLKRAGINTIEELRGMDVSKLAQLRGVGEKISEEIVSVRDGGANNE